MPRLLTALLAILLLGGCATLPSNASPTTATAEARAPVTILISIDGFRPDYLGKGDTPALDALAAKGASGAMRPAFPSKTFPNHWTVVTGKRPARNGIVANKMEDPARPGEVFTMASDDPFWWNEASPLWVEAEKAGVRTATMFWPGSNVAWGGTRATEWPNAITGGARPSDWQQFNQVVSGTQRVNALIDWLRRPADIRPKFLTAYFDIVDSAGHVFGPGAPETRKAVAEVDTLIAMLVKGLEMLGQPANIVVMADHGMAAISSERVIRLDTIAPPTDYRIIENGPYASMEPMPGREAALAGALLKPHDHMSCWRKSEIPARFHYGANPRIPAFFCLAETGWMILPSAPPKPFGGGNHGYDHEAPDMAAVFIASGPAFDAGQKPHLFDSVDVYPLLAALIGVTPLPGDGDPETLKPIVRTDGD